MNEWLASILTIIIIIWMLYLVYFFANDLKYESETKREFIAQFLIPFYWWFKWAVEWIKDTIDEYRSI